MISLLDENIIKNNPFSRLNIYCDIQSPHRHTFFEFVLVVNGYCKHALNGGEMRVIKQGTLLFLRPCDYHEIGFADRNCIYRDYYITVPEMKKLCSSISDDFYNYIINRKEPFEAELNVDEFNGICSKSSVFNNVNYDDEEIVSKLKRLHKTIIAQLLGKFIEQGINSTNFAPDWLNDLYFHIKYFDYINLTIREIISKTGYSHGYVSQMFKKYYNTSLIAYHNKTKVIYSCKLLGNMKIIDIASSLGWENPKNYAIEFKKIFNCSPMAYLKKLRNL